MFTVRSVTLTVETQMKFAKILLRAVKSVKLRGSHASWRSWWVAGYKRLLSAMSVSLLLGLVYLISESGFQRI